MSKKIYLHLGFHKTASTSFQHTCAKNTERLNELGFLYPGFKYDAERFNRTLFNHSHPIFSAFTDKPAKYRFNIRNIKNITKTNKTQIEFLDKVISEDKNIILSGEDISLLKAKGHQDLFEHLKRSGKEVVPIVVVRSPYSYFTSACQQGVRGGNVMNFARYNPQKAKIEAIREAYGDAVKFVSFSEACSHKDGPVGHLLTMMGIDPNTLNIQNSNAGDSNTFIRLQNSLNKIEPSIIDGKVNPKHKKLSPIQGSKFLLTAKELEEVKAPIDKENEYFKELLGASYCDASYKTSQELSLGDLFENYEEVFKLKKPNLSGKAVKLLLRSAESLEETDLALAHELASIVLEARPNGKVIQKKVKNYQTKLNKK